jgi:hypothetical protein
VTFQYAISANPSYFNPCFSALWSQSSHLIVQNKSPPQLGWCGTLILGDPLDAQYSIQSLSD